MSKRFNRLRDRILKKRTKCDRPAPGQQKGFDFQPLPNDLKQMISSFLPAQETLNLMQACKSMQEDLGLSRSLCSLSKQTLPQNISVYSSQKQKNPMSLIASVFPVNSIPLHSITFRADWSDHGMGERKGQLFIVAQKKSAAGTSQSKPFEQGRLVRKSALVGHDMSHVAISFHPQPDEFYQIWCHVGDEYGDLIHCKNMNLHLLSFGGSVPSCPVRRHKPSYEEDDETHMKRRGIRWMEYTLFKGPLLAD